MAPPTVSFFTDGERVPHNGSYIMSNQAYVQYIPPVDLSNYDSRSVSPVLFIHGGGLTGHMWESTPDRRPGWAVIASQRPFNRPVYILDAADSGRSQRCPDAVRSDESVEHRTAFEVWDRFRIGSREGFEQEPRIAFEGCQFPVEHFDSLVQIQSARRRSKAQYDAEMKAVAAAIREIGLCQIVAHSNGAAITCGALKRDAELHGLVKALVLVEPGPPVDDMLHLGTIRTRMVSADYLDDRFPRFRGVIQTYKDQIQHLEVMDLPAHGITGNTHFPMADRNSDEIGEELFRWLEDAC